MVYLLFLLLSASSYDLDPEQDLKIFHVGTGSAVNCYGYTHSIKEGRPEAIKAVLWSRNRSYRNRIQKPQMKNEMT